MDNGHSTRMGTPAEGDLVVSGITEGVGNKPAAMNPELNQSIYSGRSLSWEDYQRTGSKASAAGEYFVENSVEQNNTELNPDILKENTSEVQSEESEISTSNAYQSASIDLPTVPNSPVNREALKEDGQFVEETDKIIKFLIPNLAGDGYDIARRANSTFLTNTNGENSEWLEETEDKAA